MASFRDLGTDPAPKPRPKLAPPAGSFGDSGTPPWGPSHPGHSFWTVVCYVIDGVQPGLGWMVMLIAAILLYAIASPRPADAP